MKLDYFIVNEEELLNRYIDVYDLFIKYFYMPEKFESEDLEVFYGYYLNNFFENSPNKADTNYFIANLKSQIITNFEDEVIEYMFSSPFDPEPYALNLINDNLFTELSSSNVKFTGEGMNLKKIDEKVIQLQFFFSVYNACYLISLKKHQNFVRSLRNKSKSYEFRQAFNSITNPQDSIPQKVNQPSFRKNANLVQENSVERIINKDYKTFYSNLFIKLFDLNNEDVELSEKLYPKIKFDDTKFSSKLALNSYVLKQFNIFHNKMDSNIINQKTSIYDERDRYYFEEKMHESLMFMVPPKSDKLEEKSTDTRPDLLMRIWQIFETDKINEKFKIFFGFNPFCHIPNVLPFDFLKQIQIDKHDIKAFGNFKVFEFFRAAHRAEIFNSYTIPKAFEKTMLDKIKDIMEKALKNVEKIYVINTVSDAMKFLHDLKLNYIRHYEYYSTCFDVHFKMAREIVKRIRSQFNSLFKNLLMTKSIYLDDKIYYTKMRFTNFVNLLQSKQIYDELTYHFESRKFGNDVLINKDNDSESDIESELKQGGEMKKGKDDEINLNTVEMINKKKKEIRDLEMRAELGEKKFNKEVEFKKEKSNSKLQAKKANEFECFILAMSLSPNDFMDAIKYIENYQLMEFYMHLYVYLHDDIDPGVEKDYLKTMLLSNLNQKYIAFSDYLHKKAEEEKIKKEYEKEVENEKMAQEYEKEINRKLENLLDSKINMINRLKGLTEDLDKDQIKDEEEDLDI